jgi:hypothetical protein
MIVMCVGDAGICARSDSRIALESDIVIVLTSFTIQDDLSFFGESTIGIFCKFYPIY